MIRFPSETEARAAFGTAQAEYGGQFVTRIATIKYFNEVRAWSARSPTASLIIKTVETADEVINFVGMHGGFQCFDDAADNAVSQKQEPTIYVDLKGSLKVFVRTPHQLQLSRSQADNPTMEPFDNRIALLHELGHAKQFIEKPEWYRHYGNAQSRSNFREAITSGAETLWTNKLKSSLKQPPVVSTTGSEVGKPPPPPGMPPPPPGAPTSQFGSNGVGGVRQQVNRILPRRSETPKALAWFAVIDMDNIQRHEWPICRELRLPLRFSYTDLAV